jgi:hypothetical protein
MLDFLNQNSGALMVVFTAIVTISTGVYAFLTAYLVAETRKMRQAQTEPKMEIVLRPREEWIHLVNLYIRNIGLGPAYDVSFNIEPEAGGEGAKKLIEDFTTANFLKTGLKYLGPGQEVMSGYSQMTEQFNQKVETVLNVSVHYRGVTGRPLQERIRIDFSELKGLSRIGKPHLYAIAQSLENIERAINGALSGFNRLKADVYTTEDRQQEKREWEEYRNNAIAQSRKAENS